MKTGTCVECDYVNENESAYCLVKKCPLMASDASQVSPDIGIFRGRVFCFTCREERTTAPELRLTGGWPMCCGVRMLPGARL